MVHRRGPELGNRTFRISAPSSRESGWLHHNEPGSAQSFAGSHHALGSFFHSLCSTCISTSDSIFSGRVCALSAQSISCSVHKVPISDGTYENKRSIQPEKVSEGRRNFYRGFGNQRSREFVRQRRRKERERGLTAGRFDARARRAQTHSAHLRRSHPADR